MKPVSLNQLLFHPKIDALSFYRPPISNLPASEEFDTFIEDMAEQLNLQGRQPLAKRLLKLKTNIKKIIKSHPDKSHGFFVSEEIQGYVVIDHDVEAYCMMGNSFHVRPLLEEVFSNPEFILVNVSFYDIKIFKGDFHHVEIIQHYEFDQLPKNFSGLSPRIYAPQYLGIVPYKTILALKTIAQKIKDFILYQSLPVIITGLEEMKNIFVKFLDEKVGVITHLEEDFYEKTCIEILARCRNFRYVIMDYYSAQLKDRMKRMVKSKKLLTDLSQIIKASYEGRILHLVIPTEQKLWGDLVPETGEFTIHKKVGKKSVDIFNELAEEVMKQGGKIQVLGPHFFPQNTNVLAILRD